MNPPVPEEEVTSTDDISEVEEAPTAGEEAEEVATEDEEEEVVQTSTTEVESDEDEENLTTEEENLPQVNGYYAAQLHLREEGFIPEDEELNPDATWDDIAPALERRVYDREVNRIQQEMSAEYDDDVLLYARMLKQGQSPEALRPVVQLKQVADLESAELNAEQRRAVVENMYALKGYDPAEAALIIDAKAEDEEAFGELVKKSFDYHRSEYERVAEEEKKQRQQRQEAMKQAYAENERQVRGYLEQAKVGDLTLNKKQVETLRRAIYQKDQQVVVGDSTVAATDMEKFLHELSNSNELKIKAYLLINDRQGVVEQATKEAKLSIEQQFLAGKSRRPIKKDNSKKPKEPTIKPYKVIG